MKKIKFLVSAIAIMASAMIVSSCSDDDNDLKNVISALVTVKDDGNGQAYFQVDDKTVVKPTNITGMPFGKKEVRALTQYQLINENSNGSKSNINEVSARVLWVDSVLTKPTVPSTLKQVDDEAKYGNDPFEIAKNWITVAEDGYVTVQILTRWGYGNVRHRINLVRNVSGGRDPYEFRLCHDANGDIGNRYGYAIVAFNIKDIIEETGKQPEQIHIMYNSFSGSKAINLDYGSASQGLTNTSVSKDNNVVSMQ